MKMRRSYWSCHGNNISRRSWKESVDISFFALPTFTPLFSYGLLLRTNDGCGLASPLDLKSLAFFFLCPGKRIEESLSTLFFVSSDFWFSSFNLHFSLGGCHLSAYTSCSPLRQRTHKTLTHKTFTHTHCPIPLILFVVIFFLCFSRTLNIKGEIRVLMIQINTYLPQ